MKMFGVEYASAAMLRRLPLPSLLAALLAIVSKMFSERRLPRRRG